MNITGIFLAKKIKISGIVQGVGFRPFIYRKAVQYGLMGEVSNSTFGVELVIEGPECVMNEFLESISIEVPSIARVDSILVDTVPAVGFDNFSITKSKLDTAGTAIISPDVSICVDCFNEISDPSNRRYRYPFTNCTNCGPRYTITGDVPYDRNVTSMSSFEMCSLCQIEYDDPTDRRFHAQPNACAACGPRLCIVNSKGKLINVEDPVVAASRFMSEGCIVAIKGLGGFHLAVDATNESSVRRLRRKKWRRDKPFAIMSVNLDNIRSYAVINANEERLLSGVQRPIVLLKKINNSLIAESVSPNNHYVGVMLPYTPLHYIIFNENFLALVMTSGNLSGEPISITNSDAIERLGKIADYFLVHDRDILTRSDDSILKWHGGSSRIIRRSRGYVPSPINLVRDQLPVLACGAEMKNTICLTRGGSAFMSQHIGNLKSRSVYDFFKDTIKHMQHVLKVTPELIVCDFHTDYMSTRYALERQGIKVVKVQHHHAHIAACMAENKVDSPVIGLAFDGTGLGNDGTIWGGEVLIADYGSFERAACLEPVPMPGGSMAIREPWRMAISYLYRTFGKSLWKLNIPFLNSIKKSSIEVLIAMIDGKINTPQTSSIGRLFDGIAAVTGVRNKVTFEGQAAMEFEMLVAEDVYMRYNFTIEFKRELRLRVSPLVRGVVTDINNNVPVGIIAAKVHNTIVSMFVRVCLMLRKHHGVKRVALSGGVFQNALLMCRIKNNLERNDFEVLTHRSVPSNDGGISLGQAVVAPNLI